MDPVQHAFRKFVFATVNRVKDDDGAEFILLTSPRTERSYRLNPGEFELARLFDGVRDAKAVRDAAFTLLGTSLSETELEQFANELAVVGLLEAGTREPLPVPPQSDDEARSVGWQTPDDTTPPPSMLSGSLGGPGRTGSLTALWGVFRGQDRPIWFDLKLEWLLWLGRLFALPAFSTILLWGLLTFTAAGFYGLWVNYGYAGLDLLRLFENPFAAVAVVLIGAWFTNLVGQLSQAAVINRSAHVQPRFGLVLGFGLIPYFRTETAGAAEAVDRRTRLRIVGAAAVARLVLFVIGLLIWLIFRRSGGWLPVIALSEALIAMIALLIALNPLVRRDGYFLLAHALNAPDLREQSIIALFGWQRPWHETKPLPAWALRLYGALVLGYVIWIAAFILMYPARWFAGWGVTGVVIFLLLTAYLIYVQIRRVSSPRSRVGDIALAPPSQVHYAIAAALAVVALLPFPFQPSGEFVALPAQRASLNAQIDGPVTDVLVKEGDWVHAGQPVAKIGDDAQKNAVAAARATVARLKAQLALAEGGPKPQEIALAKQKVAVARKRYEFSKVMADRVTKAHANQAVSDQDYDRVLQTSEVDKQELLAAERNLALVSSTAQAEQVKAIKANIQKARSQLDFDEHQLKLATIRSPIEGQIVSGTLQFAVGDFMHRGDQLASVEQTKQLQIEIGLPETQIANIHVGAQAYVKAWAYPGRSFAGHVTQIAPDADKSPNGKIIRVVMALNNNHGRLKPGMTGYAKIDAGTYPVIVVFTRALYRFFFVEVWSWLP